MTYLSPEVDADIRAIGSIPVIPNILNVICRTTGMGFAAVARVTPGQWVACAVLDQINFGLKPGGELGIESTICHEIREQFIAILGHDLRNPLGAISNSAQVMLKLPLNEKHTRLASIIKNSAFRMNGLIENVLDFARGRLGEGIVLEKQLHESMESTLKQVISELQTVWPEREINLTTELNSPVHCDDRRVAQLFSNLLGNALTHGDKDSSVEVSAEITDNQFVLSVSNKGEKIPESVQAHLFQPFSRGKVSQDKEGLGLGLYIASEIAIAHQGELLVSSDDNETIFRLIMTK